MSGNPRRARLNDIARIADTLREPVETPDFTSSILERVHAEKPFIAPRTRRWVPMVKIGAASVSLLSVFAVTMIVFMKPELPEQLGAAPSVTTELVQSAESGFTDKVADVLNTMKTVSRAADPRQLLVDVRFAQASSTSEPTAVVEVALDTAPVERDPLSGMTVSMVTLPTPLPTPVAMATPQLPPEVADYAVFTKASFSEPRFASDDRNGGVPWQRAVAVSQPWVGRSAYLPTFAPITRPRLNPDSPMLLKELFPLITGQRAGDELQIR